MSREEQVQAALKDMRDGVTEVEYVLLGFAIGYASQRR